MSSLRGTEPGKAGNWAEKIVLGETSSGVFARGSDIRNPVLLILAGGPGGTETGWFRKYNSVLEEHFTMVHWEQRGAGKSFRLLFTDRRHMTPQQYVNDGVALFEPSAHNPCFEEADRFNRFMIDTVLAQTRRRALRPDEPAPATPHRGMQGSQT
jgi:hypothetical protein